MDRIAVKSAMMTSAVSRQDNLSSELYRIADEISNIQHSLSFNIKSRAKINSQLITLEKVCENNAVKVKKLSSTLNNAIALYSSTEKTVSQNPKSGNANNAYSPSSVIERILREMDIQKYLVKFLNTNPWYAFLLIQTVLKSIAVNYVQTESDSAWVKFWGGDLELKKEAFLFGTVSEDGESYIKALAGTLSLSEIAKFGYDKDDGISKAINKLQEKQGKDKLFPEQEKKYFKQINKDEEFYKERGRIAEFGIEGKAEGSVLDEKLSGSTDYAEGSVEGKVLTGEAHANASAGFFVYDKDKNGNVKRIFSPGVKAEVGASASVLDIEAKGRVGLGEDKNMLGLYGEGDVKALSAEAKAKVSANKNEVFAGLSAEADAVKATAKGGVSVLGTDVGVTASAKIGIGAHANIGITDGKIKCDVGAAFGVGVDVGFEIDAGGTVKAIASGAEAVWNGVTNFVGGWFK